MSLDAQAVSAVPHGFHLSTASNRESNILCTKVGTVIPLMVYLNGQTSPLSNW